MARHVRVAVLAVALIGAAACSSQAAHPDRSASPAPGSATSATGGPTSAATADPRARIAAAERTARASGRRVLVDFGADWCPDCRVLDQLYTSSTVAPILAKDYILVHVDVGHFDKNMDLSTHYGRAAAVGIPALVVLGADDRMYVSTSDGAFADARTMTPAQVATFLRRKAPV